MKCTWILYVELCLFSRLTQKLKAQIIADTIDFPPQKILDSLSEAVVTERMIGLQNFLNFVCKNSMLVHWELISWALFLVSMCLRFFIADSQVSCDRGGTRHIFPFEDQEHCLFRSLWPHWCQVSPLQHPCYTRHFSSSEFVFSSYEGICKCMAFPWDLVWLSRRRKSWLRCALPLHRLIGNRKRPRLRNYCTVDFCFAYAVCNRIMRGMRASRATTIPPDAWPCLYFNDMGWSAHDGPCCLGSAFDCFLRYMRCSDQTLLCILLSC